MVAHPCPALLALDATSPLPCLPSSLPRYWFGFPALQPPQPFALAAPPASLQAALGEAAAAAVVEACSERARAAAGAPAWLVTVGSGGEVATAPPTDWRRLQQQQDGSQGGVYLAVADSSNQPANPGWPLRNLLLMAAARWAPGSGQRCR